MQKIKGGYYIKKRDIKESWIYNAPPVVREVWDYLLREANYSDNKYNGFIIKRGQLFRSYRQIRDGLSWYIGYRKERYSESSMKRAMKALMNEHMIELTSEPRGNLITIVNYSFYQTPKNYERTNGSTDEQPNSEPRANQKRLPINKNDNKEKKDKNKDIFVQFWSAYPKRKSKGQAEKTWNKLYKSKILPDIDIILTAIENQKRSFDWKKENGQFIPLPSSWLNNHGWLDEVMEVDNKFSDTTKKNIETGKKWLERKLNED